MDIRPGEGGYRRGRARSGVRFVHRRRRSRLALWTIPRSAFNELGGLDDQLWSVGALADLRDRAAAAGISVTAVPVAGEWIGPAAYPLPALTREFLRIRQQLRTAFKTAHVDELGTVLATVAAEAIRVAWGRAGVDPAQLRFGGKWSGRNRPGGNRVAARRGRRIDTAARSGCFCARGGVASRCTPAVVQSRATPGVGHGAAPADRENLVALLARTLHPDLSPGPPRPIRATRRRGFARPHSIPPFP